MLYADPVPGATSYEFQLEFFNTHQVLSYTSSSTALNLSLVPGIFIVPNLSQGTTYRVKVRAFIGSNAGNFGQVCFINLKQDNTTLTQAIQEPRNNIFYSQLITIQATDASVIPTTSHGQTVIGVNSIAPQYHNLRILIKNAVMAEGGNQNQVQFKRINIDDALPTPVCREIFEVYFPVMVNIDNLVTQLRTTAGIKYACKPYNVMQTCGVPFTDPGASGTFSNWNINFIQAPNAWVFLQGAPTQATAIMESGSGPYVGGRASFTHPDLVGRILNAPYPVTDFSGHATSVAGVICGIPNGTGIIGVGYNTTRVASYTLAFGNYFGELAALAASTYQAGSNPRFLNCSYVHIRGVFDFTLGGWYNVYDNWTNLAPFMAPLIALQTTNNVLITASAGNSMYEGPLAHLYLRGIGYPFALPGVIGVGATFPGSSCGERGNGSGDPYAFSTSSGINWNYNFTDPTNPDPVDVVRQYDGFLDMTAPGSFIDVANFSNPGPTNTILGGSAGTSLSAPTVCAAAACMASVNPSPSFTNTDITRILFETADKVGYDPTGLTYGQLNLNNSYCLGYRYNSGLLTDPNVDYCMGHGRLNMLSALMNAAGLNTGGFTINNPMTYNCITVNDINDHTYLYTTNGYGNFNEAWEYDGVLNQNGAQIIFDGNNVVSTTVKLELASNSTFRTSNGSTLNFKNNADLLLQPGSNVSGFGTRFIIENGGTVNLSDRNFNVPSDALVEIKSGGNLDISNNTGITVQSGGTLVIRSGANLVLQGNSTITVQPGGYICIENGANITLQNTGSIINIQSGAFSGSYPQLLINTNCICPGNISFTGSGSIIHPFNDIYGFKYTTPKSIVKIDPSNGNTLQTITLLPSTLINTLAGSSTYDPNGGFYIFSGSDQVTGAMHYTIDVAT
ncbi:MAG TPA: S8 family serine peptidase, partial [Bacteroidia bacterium]